MPQYPGLNIGAFRRAVIDPAKASLQRLQQPSDDNVWKARLLGGLAGAGESLLDLASPTQDVAGLGMDPSMGVGTAAANIAEKSLPKIAPEAYSAVKGLKGLYSRLTDTMVQRMPERAFPSKIKSLAASGSSAEEQAARKFNEFLAGRDPNKVVSKQEVLSHLEQNPLELEVKKLRPATDAYRDWESRITNFEDQLHDRHGPNWRDRMTGPDLDEWNRLQHVEPPMYGAPGHDVRYREYQIPGGENYQETLIKAPKPEKQVILDANREKAFNAYADAHDHLGNLRQELRDLHEIGNLPFEGQPRDITARARELEDAIEQAQRMRDEAAAHWASFPEPEPEARPYLSSHWPEDPNVLVHSRANERRLGTPRPNPAYEDLTRQIADKEAELENFRNQRYGEDWLGGPTASTELVPEERVFIDQRQGLEDYRNLKVPRLLPVEGPKGRSIEEIQSDLHQAGRKVGYSPEENAQKAIEIQSKYGNEEGFTAQELQQWLRERDQIARGPVPDLPFKESYPDLALKEQLLEVANDPSLEWLGITGPETQIARFPSEQNVKGMQHFYGQEYPNKLAKLLKPFGVKVEKTTLPRVDRPAGFLHSQGEIYPIEGAGNYGPPVASVWPRRTPIGFDEDISKLVSKLEHDYVDNNMQLMGPEAYIARLSPEVKAAIKKVGFPAMTALLGLRNAFSGQQEQR